MSVPTKPPPSIDRLRELFSFDPTTGLFTRIVGRVSAGAVAGSKYPNGYVYLRVDGRAYRAHRLAWFWVHGTWPPEIDHIDRNPANNRIANLRPASHALNGLNRTLQVNNRSGITGVVHCDGCPRHPWRAYIKVNARLITLGYFMEKEQAVAARHAAFKTVERFHAA
jgi:hypothetical protein